MKKSETSIKANKRIEKVGKAKQKNVSFTQTRKILTLLFSTLFSLLRFAFELVLKIVCTAITL